MKVLKCFAVAFFIGFAFISPMAGQQPPRRAYTTPDLFNQEAEASDPAGIQKYSKDLIGLVVPDRAGNDYINSLSDRLANAEQLAREGKGKLIPEAEIVRSYNNLMKQIGAKTTYYADETAMRNFRTHSIAVPALPALITANRNGTNCYPGEAVYLLYMLISGDGAIPEGYLDNLVAMNQAIEHPEEHKFFFAAGISDLPMDQGAKGFLLNYSTQHHRHATIKLFNNVAKAFGL